MTKLEWEDLESTDGDIHRRARVPGGWLYKVVSDASTNMNNETRFRINESTLGFNYD